MQNFGAGADPSLIVTEPGSEAGFAPTLSYSATTDTYEGQINFSATERGTGRLRAIGATGGDLVRLQSTYRLQRVRNDQSHDIYADDGNLSLHLEPGSLPGAEAYLVVMPPGAISGPVPAGLALVGDPYDITGSGALVALEKPGLLILHYDGTLISGSAALNDLGIYHWDPVSQTWQAVPDSLDEAHQSFSASVTRLGTYALLGPPQEFTWPIFLPFITK